MHKIKDYEAYFRALGLPYVERALANGEFEEPLTSAAKTWADNTSRAITRRVTIWGVLATSLILLTTIVGLILKP